MNATIRSTDHKKLTRTTAPEPAPEYRKQVWRDSQECAHRWAANKHAAGRAGNVFFEGATVYSYGRHFAIAAHQTRTGKGHKNGAAFVLLTTRTYSVSTARHINEVRRAVPSGTTVFHVRNPTATTRAEHRANLKECAEKALELCTKARTARARKAEYEAEAARTIKSANEYAEAVGLSDRIRAPKGKDGLKEWAGAARAAERKQQEADRRARARREKEARARLAPAVAQWEQKVSAWRAGAADGPGPCPDRAHPAAELAFLRVKGAVLETSLRVAVPLKSALPVLALVRAERPYQAPTEGALSIDGFDLRTVDPVTRRVVIGCHTITFDEITRTATKHGI